MGTICNVKHSPGVPFAAAVHDRGDMGHVLQLEPVPVDHDLRSVVAHHPLALAVVPHLGEVEVEVGGEADVEHVDVGEGVEGLGGEDVAESEDEVRGEAGSAEGLQREKERKREGG